MQRQAMGVALHIVLLPFLNYCIAHLIRTTPAYPPAFFCPPGLLGQPFLCLKDIQRQGEGHARDHCQRTDSYRSTTDSRTDSKTAADTTRTATTRSRIPTDSGSTAAPLIKKARSRSDAPFLQQNLLLNFQHIKTYAEIRRIILFWLPARGLHRQAFAIKRQITAIHHGITVFDAFEIEQINVGHV